MSHTRAVTGGAEEQTRENIVVKCSPGKEKKYDIKTTVISTKSDNYKVDVQMDESNEVVKEAKTVTEADKDKTEAEAATGTETNVQNVKSPNTTGSSSFMDWSPGEPATPPGGSGSTASSNTGPGTSTPRSRYIAEDGDKQLPTVKGGMEVYLEVDLYLHLYMHYI